MGLCMIEGFSLVCRLVPDVHNNWTFPENEVFVQLLAQPQEWEKQSPRGNFSITLKRRAVTQRQKSKTF